METAGNDNGHTADERSRVSRPGQACSSSSSAILRSDALASSDALSSARHRASSQDPMRQSRL